MSFQGLKQVQGYENYYLCTDTMKVYRFKDGEMILLEPSKSYKKPTYQLYRNGIRHIVTLRELVLICLPSANKSMF